MTKRVTRKAVAHAVTSKGITLSLTNLVSGRTIPTAMQMQAWLVLGPRRKCGLPKYHVLGGHVGLMTMSQRPLCLPLLGKHKGQSQIDRGLKWTAV